MKRKHSRPRSDLFVVFRLLRPVSLVLAVQFLLFPYTMSFGNQGTTFTLVNRTQYYLHANVNGKSIVYLPPNRLFTIEIDGFSNVVAEVAYSPGQTLHGSAMKTFEVVRTNSETATSDCSKKQNTCQSSTSASSSSSVSPVTWDVTPAVLSSIRP